MAGGAGTRFWPLSTEERPKQFLDILGSGKTFIQMTRDRFEGIIPIENIYVVTNEKYKSLVREQLPDLEESNIICEPSRNNTAPCILLAALKIQKRDPDACCLFVPSDHLIINQKAFKENALKALQYASTRKAIVTIGIVPTRPETGYGYIRFDEEEKGDIKKVEQFVEKPNMDTAKMYVASGKYLWNAGMFAWHVNTINEEYKRSATQLFNNLNGGLAFLNTTNEMDFLSKNYPLTENISVDFAIMEKSNAVYTLPATFDWSDLGIWSSVFEVSAKDEANTVKIGGQIINEDDENNLIIIPSNKKALINGIKDMIIIDSGESLLIYPKKAEQNIKSSVARISK